MVSEKRAVVRRIRLLVGLVKTWSLVVGVRVRGVSLYSVALMLAATTWRKEVVVLDVALCLTRPPTLDVRVEERRRRQLEPWARPGAAHDGVVVAIPRMGRSIVA